MLKKRKPRAKTCDPSRGTAPRPKPSKPHTWWVLAQPASCSQSNPASLTQHLTHKSILKS